MLHVQGQWTLEVLRDALLVVVNGEGAADQVFRPLADEKRDCFNINVRQAEFGAHPVDGDMEVRRGMQHRAIEIDDGGADVAQKKAFRRIHNFANSLRMASITAL
jgi:hypothetical protein